MVTWPLVLPLPFKRTPICRWYFANNSVSWIFLLVQDYSNGLASKTLNVFFNFFFLSHFLTRAVILFLIFLISLFISIWFESYVVYQLTFPLPVFCYSKRHSISTPSLWGLKLNLLPPPPPTPLSSTFDAEPFYFIILWSSTIVFHSESETKFFIILSLFISAFMHTVWFTKHLKYCNLSFWCFI